MVYPAFNERWALIHHGHKYVRYYTDLAGKYERYQKRSSGLIALVGVTAGVLSVFEWPWVEGFLVGALAAIVGLAGLSYTSGWAEKHIKTQLLSADAHVLSVEADRIWRRAIEFDLSKEEQHADIDRVQSLVINLVKRSADMSAPLEEKALDQADEYAHVVVHRLYTDREAQKGPE